VPQAVAGACATGRGRCFCHSRGGACAAGSGRCFCHSRGGACAAGSGSVLFRWRGAFPLARRKFRSPWHWQVPLPRCGDRAEGARPRPLHSPALRQPHSPLRGAFTPSAFLTDRRRFAPAQRRLSPHPCGSSWKPSVVQRVGMALPNLAVGLLCFSQPPSGGKISKVRSGCADLSKTFLSRFLSLDASAWLKGF